MNGQQKYLPFYIGCQTNKGKFIGIRFDMLFIENDKKEILEFPVNSIGESLFLHLRQLNNLTAEQSNQLINEGISIGRPHGYTFSANGFIYLLSLHVDLFGLIKSGIAKEIN